MTTFEYKIEKFIFGKNFKKFYVDVFDTFNNKEVVSFYNKMIGENLRLTTIVEIQSTELTGNPICFELYVRDYSLENLEDEEISEKRFDKTIIKYVRYSCVDFDEFIEKFEKEHNQIIESI